MSSVNGVNSTDRVYVRELHSAEWWEREPAPDFPNALCKEVGVAVMFSDDERPTKRDTDTIRAMCGRCVHKVDCLAYAVRLPVPHGMMGGLTAAERIPLIRSARKNGETNGA
jgi:hypothetical protein